MSEYIVLISQDTGIIELVNDNHFWTSDVCLLPTDALALATQIEIDLSYGWLPEDIGWSRHDIVKNEIEPVGIAISDFERFIETLW